MTMSGRDGTDAMREQRDYVLQLLGSVTGTVAETPPCNTDEETDKTKKRKMVLNLEKGNKKCQVKCKDNEIPQSLIDNEIDKSQNVNCSTPKSSFHTNICESNPVSFIETSRSSKDYLIDNRHSENEMDVKSIQCSTIDTDEIVPMENMQDSISKTQKSSETIEELLKRAKEFSSHRVDLSDTLFDVTQKKYSFSQDIDYLASNSLKLNNVSASVIHENNVIDDHNKSLEITTESNLQINSSVNYHRSTCSSPRSVPPNYDNVEHATTDCSQYNLCSPQVVRDYSDCFNEKDNFNFTKGCHWSPEGDRLLVLSADQTFRVFNTPDDLYSEAEVVAPLCVCEGELVYDYAWYPRMTHNDTPSRCFVCCCRGLPVHLWSADTGQLVCSYRPFNHLDELAPTLSVGFSRDGSLLACGFNKMIRVFRTDRPGRQCTDLPAKRQNGVISSFTFHPRLHNIMAAGSYLGSIGFYNLASGSLFSLLHGHKGGLTQLTFSQDGLRLYSGARNDPELLCWDIRQMGRVLASYQRVVDTQQRVAFMVQGDLLISGATDGVVRAWMGGAGQESSISSNFVAADDCVNGVSLHPHQPVLATSSGQRHRPPSKHKPTLKLWWLGKQRAQFAG